MAKANRIQRFAAASVGYVNGQPQSNASAPNRNRISIANNVLVQQGITTKPSAKLTTNRLAREFLFNIDCTVVDLGARYNLTPTDIAPLKNRRIYSSKFYASLKKARIAPGGFLPEESALVAQNPFFEPDAEVNGSPVDPVSLNFMMQDQQGNPGGDYIFIASWMAQKCLQRKPTLKHFQGADAQLTAQRGNF